MVGLREVESGGEGAAFGMSCSNATLGFCFGVFCHFFSAKKISDVVRWFSIGSKSKACLCWLLEITHSGFLVLGGLFLSELRSVCVCLRKEKHGISFVFASYCGQLLFILRTGPLGAGSWGIAQSRMLKLHQTNF